MVELKGELLTVAEAAKLLKVTPHTIYRWIAQGRLPVVRYSPRVLRVRRSDLEGHHGGFPSGIGEARVGYSARLESHLYEDVEREEVRQLLENYRRLSRRPRGRGEPPKGSAAALLRHVGVVSKEAGEELYRIIMEDRKTSPE